MADPSCIVHGRSTRCQGFKTRVYLLEARTLIKRTCQLRDSPPGPFGALIEVDRDHDAGSSKFASDRAHITNAPTPTDESSIVR